LKAEARTTPHAFIKMAPLVMSAFTALILLSVSCGQEETDSRTITRHPASQNDADPGDSSTIITAAKDGDTAALPTPSGAPIPAVTPTASPLPEETGSLIWKALLLSGDSSIPAFDNARKEIGSIITSYGVEARNIRHLSMKSSEISGTVQKASIQNIEAALTSLEVKQGDACFVYMTSHGSPQGFYLQGVATLQPAVLDSIVTKTCGRNPTVILVSACYSGLFAEPLMQKENRIILTAAAKDRTSFGCGVENQYTFWDDCLIDNLAADKSWRQLASDIKSCIEKKEQGMSKPSLPQAFFGAASAEIPMIGS
jgi:hypothetical protein